MQAYFSHSYRDVPINTYFSGLFDAAGITLRADQKTDVWCTAKLERYMFEMDGFVSIIPKRLGPDSSIGYSPYIGRELILARRARIPHIFFIDDQVLNRYRNVFPSTSIPFYAEAPETEYSLHIDQIQQFKTEIASGSASPARKYTAKQVTVIAGMDPMLVDASSHVASILRAQKYKTVVKNIDNLDAAFEDIDLFEYLLTSELCVFVLDAELSPSDLLLAMAHAHCIPSVRLRHDSQTTSLDPELSGVVRWRTPTELRPQFLRVFENYQSAFPEATGKLNELATPQSKGTSWTPSDGPGLVAHVRPDNSYVKDVASGVMRGLPPGEGSRVHSDLICRNLYDRIKRERFYYTYEPPSVDTTVQMIRTVDEITTGRCGTCIDLVCLFAALLEATYERALMLIIKTPRGSHAIAGYYAPDAVALDAAPALEDVRASVLRGEIVLFETTGAVEAKQHTVAAETEAERREGGLMLDYQTAKAAATRLFQDELRLIHFIDVKQVRSQRNFSSGG